MTARPGKDSGKEEHLFTNSVQTDIAPVGISVKFPQEAGNHSASRSNCDTLSTIPKALHFLQQRYRLPN